MEMRNLEINKNFLAEEIIYLKLPGTNKRRCEFAEPSLYEMVVHYYGIGFDSEECKVLALEYLAELTKRIKE